MIKNQMKVAIIAAVAVVALIIAYFVVILPLTKIVTDPSVDTSEIMYTQTERSNIKSIEVTNKHGTYKFVYLEALNKYVIDGNELATYDLELFSQLVVDCGYTFAKATVETENAEKLSDYGLDEASNPAYYKLVTKEDVTYKVFVGNKIVSGGGFYARMDGESKVYILDTTLETTVLAPIESFVSPIIVNPTSLTTYAEVKTFEIYKGPYMPPDFTIKNEEEDKGEEQGPAAQDNDQSSEQKPENDKENTAPALNEPIIKVHYVDKQDLGVTSNAIYYMDYPGDGIYSPSGYVSGTLQQFIAYEGLKTVKLAPETEDLNKYGVLGDAEYTLYLINYATGTDENGKEIKIPVKNRVAFSKLHKDEETGLEYRYAHSMFFDDSAMIFNNIIVQVPEYDCAFLSYDLNTWVDSKLFSIVISTVSSMRVESGSTDILFNLAGDGEDLVVTEPNGHKPQVKNFRKFYQTILSMAKGGYVNLTDDEVKALIADESKITTKFTVKLEDGRELVYRFYSLGVQSFYTINGEGQFYLPTTQVSKVVADAIRVTRDEIIYTDNAY